MRTAFSAMRQSLRSRDAGQVLVLFVLFLVVLLGVSALAVDYANWLLTDRRLQNAADHAALAGASEWDTRQTQASCGSGAGVAQCQVARKQAWTSLSTDLGLGLTDAQTSCLANQDTPNSGWTNASQASGCTATAFGHTIWVSTPPPNSTAYTTYGGRYALTFGIVWVRVDEPTRSFFAGIFGITPRARVGWATAGALPTDFALETFCRNGISPQSGVCPNSAGLTIDGQGGIRLVRGDIGSNESLTVTSNVGSGVVVESGNVFLVNRVCATSTWNCPQVPATTGGISDADPVANPSTANNKSAFYMAPLPVPHYASPLDSNTNSAWNCSGASATNLCVPYKDQGSNTPNSPGDWTCDTASGGSHPVCGQATGSSGSLVCVGQNGGTPGDYYYPTNVSSGSGNLTGSPTVSNPNVSQKLAQEIDDSLSNPDPDTVTPPNNPPADWVWAAVPTNKTQTQTESFTVNLGSAGNRTAGQSIVRFVAFRTDNSTGQPDATSTGYPVTLGVKLFMGGTDITPITWSTITLNGAPTRYDENSTPAFTIPQGIITNFNSLTLQFTFSETGVKNTSQWRGGAVSWAMIQHPDPQPAVPPMIPPGYYRSITIPDGDASHHYCAVLDPTAEFSSSTSGLPNGQGSLMGYQMPGIYRFGGNGSNNTKKISIGADGYLIGDGVSLVFDSNWPDAGSNQGIAIGATGALVLNTSKVVGTPPCTPSEPESSTVNQSTPLDALPYSSVCAAWSVDPANTNGTHAGANAWPYCDPANVSQPQCLVTRSTAYNPTSGYRGISFYFTPSAWPPSSISQRFQMSGGSSSDPGLAFRGVMYAPYDYVQISGGNGFNTIGQVLSWSAKFNGGSAYIDLDYPYSFTPSAPYLLEPTIAH